MPPRASKGGIHGSPHLTPYPHPAPHHSPIPLFRANFARSLNLYLGGKLPPSLVLPAHPFPAGSSSAGQTSRQEVS